MNCPNCDSKDIVYMPRSPAGYEEDEGRYHKCGLYPEQYRCMACGFQWFPDGSIQKQVDEFNEINKGG